MDDVANFVDWSSEGIMFPISDPDLAPETSQILAVEIPDSVYPVIEKHAAANGRTVSEEAGAWIKERAAAA
jgi:hypothetical protein